MARNVKVAAPAGWICDTCRQAILTPEDGWVEWIEFEDKDGNLKGRNLRLVHHSTDGKIGCQFNQRDEFKKDEGTISDDSLENFLGADGLISLLELVSRGRLPKEEVLEMIKRLHAPGYEHARLYFKRAISEGVFEPNMPAGYYWSTDIKATLDYAKDEGLI